MNFRVNRISFNVLILIELLIFGGGIVTSAYFYWQSKFGLFLLLLVAVASLLRLIVKQINTQQLAFINALEYLSNNELQISLPSKYVSTEFKHMIDVFVAKLNKSRNEVEARRYLNEIIADEIPVAMLAVESDGSIVLSNRKLHEMLDTVTINSLNDIKTTNSGLYEALLAFPNNSKQLIEMGGWAFQVSRSEIGLLSKRICVYTIESVEYILEAKEVSSWNKVLQVLTHEIMNSITPISSLTQSIKQRLESIEIGNLPLNQQREVADITRALSFISSRCKTLDDFMKSYREHASIPTVNKRLFDVCSLFSNISDLYRLEQESQQFVIRACCEPMIKIYADEGLIEQVLINLIKNAIEAMETQPEPIVQLKCKRVKNHVIVSVIDNGTGIADEDFGNVFVPFFSTKKSGSGIGLSLCRKIILAHNAKIYIEKNTPRGTQVHLRF